MAASAWLDTPLLRWGLPVALLAALLLLRDRPWGLRAGAAPILYLGLLRLLSAQDWPGALMLLAALADFRLGRDDPTADLFAQALVISLASWTGPESVLLVGTCVLCLRLQPVGLTADAERWIGLGLLALHPTVPALVCLVAGYLATRSLWIALKREDRSVAAPGLALGWLAFQLLRLVGG